MNKSTADILARLIQDGEKASSSTNDMLQWGQKAIGFVRAAMPSEATTFVNLAGGNYTATHALRLGHLYGLAARAEEISPRSEESRKATDPSATHIAQSSSSGSRRVFVVHGHDDAAKEALACFLTKLSLDPIILHEQASGGRTIIEKFETYSGDVAFAVVLLTPDDVGAAKSNAARLSPRARQNVILELGYFMGRLGRTNVCALHKGGVELPSDYQGIVYVEMDEANGWKAKLAQELVQAKLPIDLSGLLGG